MPKWSDWKYGSCELRLKGIVIQIFWDNVDRGYKYYILGLTSRESFKIIDHAKEAAVAFAREMLQENLKMLEE